MSTVRVEWDDVSVKTTLRAAAQSASFDAAAHVARMAQLFAPVGSRKYSGKRGGKSWKSRTPGRLKLSIVPHRSKFMGGGAVVTAGGGDAFYARFVELGTPGTTRRTKKSGKKRKAIKASRTPIKAQPFLGKALKASSGKVREIIEKELNRRLSR